MNRSYLIVDDNPEYAENIAEILRDSGSDADIALSGREALTQLRARSYDALVTDMRMPEMNGSELVEEVRRFDPLLPVVLLSAFTEDAMLARARRSGLLAVLSKPQGVERLLETLGQARRAVVLLVEDDHALAENLAEALAHRGITVYQANTLGELDALTVQPFAALVDLKVPGGPVGQSLEKVKARFPGVPTLTITAFAPEVGATDVYRKPFDTEALLDHLERLYAASGPT